MPNVWDRRKASEGDITDTAVFEAVGRALSQWAEFEEMVSELFALCVSGSKMPSYEGHRVFGAITTFEGRLDMLRAASQVRFLRDPNDVLKKELESLIGVEWRSAGKIRNDIAHGRLDTQSVKNQAHKREFFWAPAENDFRKTVVGTDEAKFRYSSTDLRYYETQFALLPRFRAKVYRCFDEVAYAILCKHHNRKGVQCSAWAYRLTIRQNAG